jgi:hypothetical protein
LLNLRNRFDSSVAGISGLFSSATDNLRSGNLFEFGADISPLVSVPTGVGVTGLGLRSLGDIDFSRFADNLSSGPGPFGRQFGAVNFGDRSLLEEFRSFNTPSRTPANLFEIEQTGPFNFTVLGGGTKVDIDGFTGSTILEAKFIGNPNRSPFIEGSNIPDFLRNKIAVDQRDEFFRFGSVIADPAVPFNNLNVLINDQRAAPFFQSLINEFSIPGEVTVVPTQIKLPGR